MEIDYVGWFLQTVAMLVTALLIPGFKVKGPLSALLLVVALALVNAHIWDAALFFSVPNSLTIQTAVLLVANAVLFFILVKILPGVEINGILPALVAPVLFTILGVLADHYGREIDWATMAKKGFKEGTAIVDQVKQTVRPTPQSKY